MTFLILKSLHLVFAISWFAGLFYIIRLFVYQTEAEDFDIKKREILSSQYKLMAKRLWYIISWPAMIFTVSFGTGMLFANPALLQMDYIILKLMLVTALVFYHLYCHYLFINLQKDKFLLKSFSLRLINEIATLLLFAIVFTIVIKSLEGFVWGIAGLFALGIIFFIIAKIYKKNRDNNN